MPFELRSITALAATSLLAIGLSGCSISPDEDSPTVAYEDAESDRPLEVPPDLTQPDRDGSMTIPEQRSARRHAGGGSGSAGGAQPAKTEGRLLPQFDGIRLVRGGETAWIEVDDVPPEQVWPRLEGFLKAQGLSIARKKPELGLIETPWFDRADLPDKQGISGFISGLFSSGGQTRRHKYQIQLERANGGTRIFVEHRRAVEVANSEDPKRDSTYTWQPEGGQPAVENELRKRLLVYLGVSQQRAEGIISDREAEAMLGGNARLKGEPGDEVAIRVEDSDYRRVFAQVGRALDIIGAETTEAARSEGRYRIEWTPPSSVRDGQGSPRSLQVRVRRADEHVQVIAADADGTRGKGPVYRALLTELVEAMGGPRPAQGDGETTVPTPESAKDQDSGTDGGSDDDGRDYEDADDDGLPDSVPGV